MSTTYKLLAQTTSNGTIYTVPAGTSAVISTISICHIGKNPITIWDKPDTYRVAVVKSGTVSPDSKSWIVYDAQINSGDTVSLTLGITMSAGDYIYVITNTLLMPVMVFGAEIT